MNRLERELARCRREIAHCERHLREGLPDEDGALLGLHDWSDEMGLIAGELAALAKSNGKAMSEDQEQHLESIKGAFCRMVDAKYRDGAQEYGSNLRRDYGALALLEHAIHEAIDQVTYLLTLRELFLEGKATERRSSGPSAPG